VHRIFTGFSTHVHGAIEFGLMKICFSQYSLQYTYILATEILHVQLTFSNASNRTVVMDKIHWPWRSGEFSFVQSWKTFLKMKKATLLFMNYSKNCIQWNSRISFFVCINFILYFGIYIHNATYLNKSVCDLQAEFIFMNIHLNLYTGWYIYIGNR
jgi:hypothetical protein